MKTAIIYTTDQRKIYTTNDMEDVRMQIVDNSSFEGNGFITISSIGDAVDVNIQHIVRIEYININEKIDLKNITTT